VGVFDASSPSALFSYQYTAPTLRNGTQGVQAVTEDSVYRIGSLSKLITAYTFLLAAGPKYWEYPVTKFLPELREAAKLLLREEPRCGLYRLDLRYAWGVGKSYGRNA